MPAAHLVRYGTRPPTPPTRIPARATPTGEADRTAPALLPAPDITSSPATAEKMTPKRARAYAKAMQELTPLAPKRCALMLCVMADTEQDCAIETQRIRTASAYFVAGVQRELLGKIYQLLGNIDVRTHVAGEAGTSREEFYSGFLKTQPAKQMEKFFKATPLPQVFSGKRIQDALSSTIFTHGNASIHDLTVGNLFAFLGTLRASSTAEEAVSAPIWQTFAVVLVGRGFDDSWRDDQTRVTVPVGQTARSQDATLK
ncbi:hypothetical protein C8F01DRAFT_1259484 [Mycena amicta]|nr:hypothetical protein C8F01DRAFT_1259484 [Mycena amicta]